MLNYTIYTTSGLLLYRILARQSKSLTIALGETLFPQFNRRGMEYEFLGGKDFEKLLSGGRLLGTKSTNRVTMSKNSNGTCMEDRQERDWQIQVLL